jgi:hypothetical protein
MMPIDWGKRALGDFRSWHLADMRVSANVRFAPEAVIQQLISFQLFAYRSRLTPFYAFPYQSRTPFV